MYVSMHCQQMCSLNIDPSVCVREIDMNWNISWPSATRGEVVQQKCPGGAESVGMYYIFAPFISF